jgi:hypothetical protein
MARSQSGGRSAAAAAVAAIRDGADADAVSDSSDHEVVDVWPALAEAVAAAGGLRARGRVVAAPVAAPAAAPGIVAPAAVQPSPAAVAAPVVAAVPVAVPPAAAAVVAAPVVAAVPVAVPVGPPVVAAPACAVPFAHILPPAHAPLVAAFPAARADRKAQRIARREVPVAVAVAPSHAADVARIAALEAQLAVALQRGGGGHGSRARESGTDSSDDDCGQSPASRLQTASFAEGIRDCLLTAGQVSCRRFVETESFKDNRARNECVALAEIIDVATSSRGLAGALVPWSSPIVEAVARRLVGVMTADRTGNWTIATVVSRSAGSLCPLVSRDLAVVMAKAANAIDRVDKASIKSKRTTSSAARQAPAQGASKKPRRKARGGKGGKGGGSAAAAADAAEGE